jgi:hypothetical protein
MATLPIHLEVEDVAVGPVLIALRKMPGIIKMNLDLLTGAPATPSLPKPKGGKIYELVMAVLIRANGHAVHLDDIAREAGVEKNKVHGALNALGKRHIAQPAKDAPRGNWTLTEKAKRGMINDVKLLPAPHKAAPHTPHAKHHAAKLKKGPKGRAVRGQAWLALRSALDAGPVKRFDLVPRLATMGVKANSVSGMLERGQRDKLIKSDGAGLWELTDKGRQQPNSVEA